MFLEEAKSLFKININKKGLFLKQAFSSNNRTINYNSSKSFNASLLDLD